jgi:hypothetical protein
MAKPTVTDRFEDGRWPLLLSWNVKCLLKIGNYRRISKKFGTQTNTSTLSSKITKAEVHGHFQDGHF